MKKILAVALALMMLLASAACAETTNRITLSDPVLDMKLEFQEFQTDLAGMSIELNSGSMPAVIKCSVPFLYVMMPLRIN